MYGELTYNAEKNMIEADDKFYPFQTGYDCLNGIYSRDSDVIRRSEKKEANDNPIGRLIEAMQEDGMRVTFYLKKFMAISYVNQAFTRKDEKATGIHIPTDVVHHTADGVDTLLPITASRSTYAEDGHFVVKRRGRHLNDKWVDQIFTIDDVVSIEAKYFCDRKNTDASTTIKLSRKAGSWNNELTMEISTLDEVTLNRYINFRTNDTFGTESDKEKARQNEIVLGQAFRHRLTMMKFPLKGNNKIVEVKSDAALALLCELHNCDKVDLQDHRAEYPYLAHLHTSEFSGDKRLHINNLAS